MTKKLSLMHFLFIALVSLLVSNNLHAQATFADDELIYGGSATTVQWGDIDGDGLQDMFIAEGGKHSGGNSVLSWFKAPDWTEYAIGPDLTTFTGDSDLVDIDNDGHLDIVIPRDNHNSQNPPGSMQWYKNPGDLGASPNQFWTKFVIEANVPDAFHLGDLETSDVDNDGKLDVVVRHLGTRRYVVYFQNSASDWDAVRVDPGDLLRNREGLVLGDFNNDNKTDIVGNGYILFAPANPRACVDSNPVDGVDRCEATWTSKTFDANYYNAPVSGLNNSTKGAAYDMDGDGRLDILQSSAEGNAVYLAWYKNPDNALTGSWTRNLIESPQSKNHNVELGDVDLDGDIDVLGGFSFGANKVYWWENTNGNATSWTRHEINGTRGCYSCVAADYDNDGDIDFAGPTRYANKVYLYRNTTADASTALGVSPQTVQFPETGGDQILTITSDISWTATSSESWLTLSTAGASAGMNITISASARSDTDFGTRTAVVSVSNGTIIRNVNVSQLGAQDTAAPTTPANLATSNVSYDSLLLDWNDSTDNSGSVQEYIVYLNSFEEIRSDTSFVALTGLTPETNYSIQVSAVDPSGNESARSSIVNSTTTERPASAPAVANWKMDETTGTVANDSAIAGNHGTFAGGMASNQWDSINQLLGTAALRFDGGSERVDLGKRNAPANALTLMGWLKPTNIESNNGEGRILSKASGSNANDHYWMLSTDENSANVIVPRVRLKTAGSTTTLVGTSLGEVENDVWSQIVATYDGATITLYHNGVSIGSASASGTVDQSDSVDAVIGNQPAGDRGFEGLIDEVCIFDYAITPEDVEYLYNSGNGRTCDSLQSGSNPDVTAPVLTEVKAVSSPTTETNPGYTYSTSEAGTAVYGGSCSATLSSEVAAGEHSISFETLAVGTYSDCTVVVTDAEGNASDPLLVSEFTITAPDTTPVSVTVNQAPDQADPTNSNLARFVVTFSEPIDADSFTADDISLAGTGGSVQQAPSPVPNSGDMQYTFSVTDMTSGDQVSATILAGQVQNLSGNDNTAATATDNTVTYVCNGCDIEDQDQDGVADAEDNCPATVNEDQTDSDNNGIGDVCQNEGMCFPVKTETGAVVLICL